MAGLTPLGQARPVREVTAYIGVGANLGDAVGAVRSAFSALEQIPATRVSTVSSLYRTQPIASSGPDYVNAVAELTTALTAPELLAHLQAIEQRAGRERPYRNAPRTLDLDLLLYGQRIVDEPTLQLPHPRLHDRAFVLRPLLEIAPELVHPLLGPLAARAAAVDDPAIHKLPVASAP